MMNKFIKSIAVALLLFVSIAQAHPPIHWISGSVEAGYLAKGLPELMLKRTAWESGCELKMEVKTYWFSEIVVYYAEGTEEQVNAFRRILLKRIREQNEE